MRAHCIRREKTNFLGVAHGLRGARLGTVAERKIEYESEDCTTGRVVDLPMDSLHSFTIDYASGMAHVEFKRGINNNV